MRRATRAFTLVEILIVVVILGILAAIVVPSFAEASEESKRTVFATDLRQFVEAAILYENMEGEPVPDLSSGTTNETWSQYADPDVWTSPTAIGGVWDAELNSFGVRSAIGVHFNGTGSDRDDDYMILIDAMIDDNNLETGGFRRLGDGRYYSIFN
ncbi:MAG: hypothetical protein Tsb0013_24750 [Phycisphaerales bacterium]